MRHTLSIMPAIAVSVVLTTAFMIPLGTNYSVAQGAISRDSQTILLDGKTIPGGGFIHLYDSTPYKITNGHIAANIPCDETSTSPLAILVGEAPNLSAANLTVVNELSNPGTICIYHVDIPLNATAALTDIAIQNPTDSDEELPDGSTVVIGVNEIEPLG
ncbi:MAG TPA: hypothetical protein VE130_14920 [Nitrososphaeraceae archaeon]|nr:hypothetical protein [Nitrososphaeraceae archaeon]